MGVQNEMEIAKLVKSNQSLLKLGAYLEIRTARLLVLRYIERNIDNRKFNVACSHLLIWKKKILIFLLKNFNLYKVEVIIRIFILSETSP